MEGKVIVEAFDLAGTVPSTKRINVQNSTSKTIGDCHFFHLPENPECPEQSIDRDRGHI